MAGGESWTIEGVEGRSYVELYQYTLGRHMFSLPTCRGKRGHTKSLSNG